MRPPRSARSLREGVRTESNLEGVMGETEQHDEQVSAPEADYAGLLRALTVERFAPWRPPESATERAPSARRQQSKAPAPKPANPSDVPNVRGPVHDGKSSIRPWRTR